MVDAPNVKTFDIAEMFSGRSFPTDSVTVYTDQGIGYEFDKLSRESVEAVQRKDKVAGEAIVEKREELLKRAEKFRYEIHLRGVSRDDEEAVEKLVRAEFPEEKDIWGRTLDNSEADEKFTILLWTLYIEKIVNHEGAVIVAPGEDAIRIIRAKLHLTEQAKIGAAIGELSEGAKRGYEALAQEHDFLSSASPEA